MPRPPCRDIVSARPGPAWPDSSVRQGALRDRGAAAGHHGTRSSRRASARAPPAPPDYKSQGAPRARFVPRDRQALTNRGACGGQVTGAARGRCRPPQSWRRRCEGSAGPGPVPPLPLPPLPSPHPRGVPPAGDGMLAPVLLLPAVGSGAPGSPQASPAPAGVAGSETPHEPSAQQRARHGEGAFSW